MRTAGLVFVAGCISGSAAIKANSAERFTDQDAASACTSKPPSFSKFVKTHRKQVQARTEEYKMRQELYNLRVAEIQEHNCNPKGPWVAKVNQFADWTPEELETRFGYKRTGHNRASLDTSLTGSSVGAHAATSRDIPIPETLSWLNTTSISTPRDQGQCGSCWAFAAETALRARAEIHNQPFDFSVSQIVACSPNPNQCGGKGGCDGATAELAYEYLLKAGMVTNNELKYPSGGGQSTCPERLQAKPDTLPGSVETSLNSDGGEEHRLITGAVDMRGADIGMIGWTKLAENKEMPLVRALVEEGPVAIAVAAGSDWSFYSRGILTKEGCDQSHVINHAVTLFGYGVATHASLGQVKFWRIKNSWGEFWGENGNLRLERLADEEGYCGWDNQPEVGSGCLGGPKQVWVCGSCGILYDVAAPHFAWKN